jgi:hypothetical protein
MYYQIFNFFPFRHYSAVIHMHTSNFPSRFNIYKIKFNLIHNKLELTNIHQSFGFLLKKHRHATFETWGGFTKSLCLDVHSNQRTRLTCNHNLIFTKNIEYEKGK